MIQAPATPREQFFLCKLLMEDDALPISRTLTSGYQGHLKRGLAGIEFAGEGIE